MTDRPFLPALVLALLAWPAAASAQEPAPVPAPAAAVAAEPAAPPPALRRMAVGYGAGNGVLDPGALGAEVVFRPGPHLAFALLGGRMGYNGFGGFGLAPSLRWSLEPDGGPYVALGGVWFGVGAGQAAATTRVSGLGGFANVGYEWRPNAALGVYGGLGAGFMPGTTVERNGFSSAEAGSPKLNLELGVRWYPF